jgi:hypothetical protein
VQGVVRQAVVARPGVGCVYERSPGPRRDTCVATASSPSAPSPVAAAAIESSSQRRGAARASSRFHHGASPFASLGPRARSAALSALAAGADADVPSGRSASISPACRVIKAQVSGLLGLRNGLRVGAAVPEAARFVRDK